jgi:hypothetical protein
MHFGMRDRDLASARSSAMVQMASAAFFFCHAGYRMNCLLHEVYGAQHKRFMEAGGFRLLKDFQAASPSRFAGMPAEDHPYVFDMRKGMQEAGAINQSAALFEAREPMIGFSPAEQHLLMMALIDDSDGALARDLDVSRDAVKKVWSAIYARVEREAPYLLPQAPRVSGGRRGHEKRRHLLNYLRTHLEELRPHERRRRTRVASRRRV